MNKEYLAFAPGLPQLRFYGERAAERSSAVRQWRADSIRHRKRGFSNLLLECAAWLRRAFITRLISWQYFPLHVLYLPYSAPEYAVFEIPVRVRGAQCLERKKYVRIRLWKRFTLFWLITGFFIFWTKEFTGRLSRFRISCGVMNKVRKSKESVGLATRLVL